MLPRTYRPLTTLCRRYLSQTRSHSSSTNPKIPLHLMPLGDSITHGHGSTHGTGYRSTLYTLLQSAGHNVTMLGSQSDGTMPHNNHEGWPGHRIDGIHDEAEQTAIELRPNLFTVHAGMEDCAQDYEVDEAGERMASMLRSLWSASPGSTVLLSSLLVNGHGETEGRAVRVNEQFRRLVASLTARGRRIVYVDMRGSEGPRVGELADGTHPGDVGYERMARLWYRGVQEAEAKKFLRRPDDDVEDMAGDVVGVSVISESVGSILR